MKPEWKRWEGQVVNGEFHLRRYVGGSDHSAVFVTERSAQQQKTAIKLVPADPQNSDLQLSRWEGAGKLSHPHLLRLFQAGRCELGGIALLYVVTEYAEENLSEVLPQRPLNDAEARDMLRPVLDALAYLHGKGLVHGHIKPANIMVVADQLRLSSDGICAFRESTGSQPSVYDPPEAVSGTTSSAGDVWSLGMTLVETLTQRVPGWDKTQRGDPALPATLQEPFRSVARNCLRRNPEERWTVAEIKSHLWPTPVAPFPTLPDANPGAFAKWGYMVPLIAACLVLAALAGPRLLNRTPEAQPAPAAVETPKIEAQPKPSPATSNAGTPDGGTSHGGSYDSKPSAKSNAPPKSNTPPPAALRPVATVKPSSRVVHGEVLQQVSPEVSQSALRTIQGTVRVKVRVEVDPSGAVTGAKFDSAGPSKYFANRALQAARRWEFSPAEVDGRKVASEWVLRFEFARASAKAFPTPATP
jgi:TonB family protein